MPTKWASAMKRKSYPGVTSYDVEIASQLKAGEISRYLMALAAVRRGLDVQFETYIADHDSNSFRGSAPNYNGRYLRITDSKKTVFFDGTRGHETFAESNNIAADKEASKNAFIEHHVSTPQSCIWTGDNPETVKEFFKNSEVDTFVIKPTAGSLGEGVIQAVSADQILAELQNLRGRWIIEEYIQGSEMRVYVVGGQVVSAFYKKPPSVVGDGIGTFRDLIRKSNDEVRRSALPWDLIDEKAAEFYLNSIGRSLDDKPRYLETCNVGDKVFSAGAQRASIDRVPDHVRTECIKAVRATGIPNGGVDVIACSKPGKAYVLEVNPRANILHHTFPKQGKGHGLAVPDAILSHYFPKSQPVEAYSKFPLNFTSIQHAMSSGFVTSVAPIRPGKDWIRKRVTVECTCERAEKIIGMLKLMCIFVHWWHREEGNNIIDAFFLPRGLVGYRKTMMAHNVPVVSAEVDQQILAPSVVK